MYHVSTGPTARCTLYIAMMAKYNIVYTCNVHVHWKTCHGGASTWCRTDDATYHWTVYDRPVLPLPPSLPPFLIALSLFSLYLPPTHPPSLPLFLSFFLSLPLSLPFSLSSSLSILQNQSLLPVTLSHLPTLSSSHCTGITHSIRCHCDQSATLGLPSVPCAINNFTCSSPRGCYLRRWYASHVNTIVQVWGCISDEHGVHDQVDYTSIICGLRNTPTDASKCCNTTDFCNSDLHIILPMEMESPSPSLTSTPTPPHNGEKSVVSMVLNYILFVTLSPDALGFSLQCSHEYQTASCFNTLRMSMTL